MQRITRRIIWAVLFEALNLLAQAQNSASSPQKPAADQTFSPDSGVPVLTSPSTQNGAEVIVESIPVLTIDEAVALAVKGNRQVRSTALGVDAAQQETAALRASRWPQFKTYLLGGGAAPDQL
jgi:hypothetical protein